MVESNRTKLVTRHIAGKGKWAPLTLSVYTIVLTQA